MSILQVFTCTRPNSSVLWNDPNYHDPDYSSDLLETFLNDGRIVSSHVAETDTTKTSTVVFRDVGAITDWWFARMGDASAKATYANLVDWQQKNHITTTITRDFNHTP